MSQHTDPVTREDQHLLSGIYDDLEHGKFYDAAVRMRQHYALPEEDRQLVVLALAKLTFSRPGFAHALREVAVKFKAEAMFDELVKFGPDIEAQII